MTILFPYTHLQFLVFALNHLLEQNADASLARGSSVTPHCSVLGLAPIFNHEEFKGTRIKVYVDQG